MRGCNPRTGRESVKGMIINSAASRAVYNINSDYDYSIVNLDALTYTSSPEAFRSGFITADQLRGLAAPLIKSGYGAYLMRVLEEPNF